MLRNVLLVSATTLVLVVSPAFAEELKDEGQCYLEVDQTEYIIGNCHITQSVDKDGDPIGVSFNNGKWFAFAHLWTDKPTLVWGLLNGDKQGETLGVAKDDGNGCYVNDRVRMCASLSTTPIGYSFVQEGHCKFEAKGKSLIDGDCTYFKFDGMQSEDGHDLKTGKLIVMNEDQTVTAMVMSTSNPELGNSATLFRILRLGDKPQLVEIGAPEVKGACWVTDDAKLCVGKE